MKICPFCKKEIEDNSRFCIYCMSPLSEKKKAAKIKPLKKGWQIISAVLLVFTTAIVLILSVGQTKGEPTPSSSHTQTQTDASDLSQFSALSSDNGGLGEQNTDSRIQIARPSGSATINSQVSIPTYTPSSWYDEEFFLNFGDTSSVSSSVAAYSESASASNGTAIAQATTSSKAGSASSKSTSSTVTITSATEGYYTYSVTDGKATITDVRENKISGAVTIPSKLGGYSVVSIGEESFRDCTNITSVVIPEGVTYIGINAFSGCTGISKVTIPDSVVRIDDMAFDACSSLMDIILPEKLISIGMDAFTHTAYYDKWDDWESETRYLDNYLIATVMTTTTVCRPKESTRALIGFAYYGCKLDSFSLPKSLIYIGEGAFYNCGGLTSLTVPGHVKYIGYSAFAHFESLETVTIESGITKISDGMFEGCKNLETIHIPKSVTSIGRCAFENCKYLTDIYYEGSKADRDKMLIDSEENSYLLNATWHYNS